MRTWEPCYCSILKWFASSIQLTVQFPLQTWLHIPFGWSGFWHVSRPWNCTNHPQVGTKEARCRLRSASCYLKLLILCNVHQSCTLHVCLCFSEERYDYAKKLKSAIQDLQKVGLANCYPINRFHSQINISNFRGEFCLPFLVFLVPGWREIREIWGGEASSCGEWRLWQG